MLRLAAVVFAFWSVACVLGTALTAVVAVAPASRSSLLAPVALLVLAVLFGTAARATWRPAPGGGRVLRYVALLVGPGMALLAWSTRGALPASAILLPVLAGWLVLAAVVMLLARRLERSAERAPVAAG